VRAQVVEYNADAICVRIVDVDQVTHALGEIVVGTLGRDLDVAPRAMGIDESEDVDGAVASVLVVDARDLTRLRPNRDAGLAQQLVGLLVEADDRPRRIGLLGVQLEHVLHPLDKLRVDRRDAPHLPSPRLELVLGESPPYRLA